MGSDPFAGRFHRATIDGNINVFLLIHVNALVGVSYMQGDEAI
jgi:hypothetical protein